MANTDFERFYYTHVALGEGCGCAEQTITPRDLEARYGVGARGVGLVGWIFVSLRRLLAR